MIKCPECNKELKSEIALRSHKWRAHTNEGKNHSVPVWNKGLTKNDHPSIMAKLIEVKKSKIHKYRKDFTSKPHTEEAKRKISQAMSINNKGGRCKWYEVSGQKVQGTWERDFAIELDKREIKWKKITEKKYTLQYVMDGKVRHYSPDFYLEEFDTYIEIKGRWWGNDREKMKCVIEQHSDKRIVIIEKDLYQRFMRGEQVW